MKKSLSLLIVSILFGFIDCFGQLSLQSNAPNFVLKDIEGNIWSSDKKFSGKFTIVLFWATWGNDSIEMLDQVNRLMARYRVSGLEAVGVCVENQHISDSTVKRIGEITQKKNISFPIVVDQELKTFRKYGVIAVPTTYIIDSTEKIVFHLSGYPLTGREKFSEFIREHFEGKRNIIVQHKFSRQPDKHALRLHNMASMKFNRGELDTAKKYAQDAAVIDSGFVEPLILLAEIALEENDFSFSEKYISRLLSMSPSSLEVQALSGLLAAKKGDTARSSEILKNVLEQSDTLSIAHCYMGYLMGTKGDSIRSEIEMSRAAELSPSDYRIPMLRAEIFESRGKRIEAQELKKKAKQLRRKR